MNSKIQLLVDLLDVIPEQTRAFLHIHDTSRLVHLFKNERALQCPHVVINFHRNGNTYFVRFDGFDDSHNLETLLRPILPHSKAEFFQVLNVIGETVSNVCFEECEHESVKEITYFEGIECQHNFLVNHLGTGGSVSCLLKLAPRVWDFVEKWIPSCDYLKTIEKEMESQEPDNNITPLKLVIVRKDEQLWIRLHCASLHFDLVPIFPIVCDRIFLLDIVYKGFSWFI